MKLHPRVTRTGVELVKRFEGLRRRAARLPDGGWTIGYGHTVSAREGAEVTPEDAEALLYYDLSEVAGKLEAWTFTTLNQNQFEALTAFAFNIGLENFRNSTVLKRVNEGQHLLAGAAMELWRKADFNGEDLVIDALVRRRAAEKAHYLTPPEGFRPSPSPVLKPTFDHSVIEAAAQAQAARHATVVDVPMDGENAVAVVEAAPEIEHSSPINVSPAAAHVEAQTVMTPEAPAPLVLESPGALHETQAPEPNAEPAHPSNDRNGFDAPSFPGAVAAAATVTGFRGFEPPPRRFDFNPEARALPPEPANEPHLPTPTFEPAPEPVFEAAPAVEPAAPAPTPETPSDFTLFDQPLAPPTPTVSVPLQAARSMRLAADDEGAAGEATSTQPAVVNGVDHPHAPGFLRNRVFLYASVGVLGVFLFSIAVGNMAFGKASSATLGTLFMGVFGIVLMTPAGVWFLMRRLNTPQDEAHA